MPPQPPPTLTGKAGAGRVCPRLAHSHLDTATGLMCREFSCTVFCQLWVIKEIERGRGALSYQERHFGADSCSNQLTPQAWQAASGLPRYYPFQNSNSYSLSPPDRCKSPSQTCDPRSPWRPSVSAALRCHLQIAPQRLCLDLLLHAVLHPHLLHLPGWQHPRGSRSLWSRRPAS